MEHKLILGGEQFLPFARSRIKALRATGLSYASQQFEVDGVTIKVRIAGDQEYIRLEGGSSGLFMDSGLVDLKAWNPANPLSGQTGILYDTVRTTAYHADFQPTSPATAWKTNPSTGNAGQVAGLLTLGKNKITGKIPYPNQPARSFQPGTKKDDAGLWQRLVDDPDIIPKKNIAQNCPPSIFTGRCRLYIQSVYGATAYKGSEKDDLGAESLRITPQPFSLSYASVAPMLKIPAKSPDSPPVLLTTDSGVFLDDDGTHWLFNPVGETVEVYPLRSSVQGEKLRKYITAENILGLSDDERLHIESYVLMDCRPDVKAKTVATGRIANADGRITGRPAMGYGWHWNWSGTRADIVLVDEYLQDTIGSVQYFGNKSSHYRMTMARDKTAGTWSVTLIAVAENKLWSTGGIKAVATYPDWATGLLQKVTPPSSFPVAGEAPFYAFYLGDVLKVCSVNISYTPAGVPATDGTTGYPRTTGLGGMSYNVYTTADPYYSITFSCGDATTGAIQSSWAVGYTRVSETPKTQVRPFARTAQFPFFTPSGSFAGALDGYNVVSVAGPGNMSDAEVALIRTESTTDQMTRQNGGAGVAVIPPYDSEAIYLHAETTRYESGTQLNRTQIESDTLDFYTLKIWVPQGGTAVDYYGLKGYYTWSDTPNQPVYTPLSVSTITPTTTNSITCNTLICNVSAPVINNIDISTFVDTPGEIIVERDFRTLTSAARAAVIPQPTLGAPVGCSTTGIVNPAFVGWA